MPFGRSPRHESRKPSSSLCSTATLVVFVALCLVGVWMMTSTTVVPVDIASSASKSEVKQEVSETEARPSEADPQDVSNDAVRGDTDPKSDGSSNKIGSESESAQDGNIPEKATEDSAEIKTQEVNPDKGDDNSRDGSDDASSSQTFRDENGKTEDGEVVKGSADTNRGESETQENNTEQNSQETTGNEKETASKGQFRDPEQDGGGNNGDGQQQSDGESSSGSSEQSPDETKGNEQQPPNEGTSGNDSEQSNDSEVSINNPEQDPSRTEGGKQQQSDSEKTAQLEEKSDGSSVPGEAQPELRNEPNTQTQKQWSTQAGKSKHEKEAQAAASPKARNKSYTWKLCNANAGADYIPCLDNVEALKKLKSTKHYEHRERHCPDEGPTCVVPLPKGYKRPIEWPQSRDKIWYSNVPHTQLVAFKGHQNWVKVTGEYLSFPGGGTQFTHGALHYIDFVQESWPDIAWGKRSRVALDVGCGVASFGGYIFDRDVLTFSFAPKDEHEAQVQFALERGIPAISAVMGTKRLPFPARVFDVIHCARCRVPWHIEGGKLLLELNRVLRPGGYFIWSATPVYQKLSEDVEIWDAMSELTKSICWEMVNKTKKEVLNHVGVAIYRKPTTNECYEKRMESKPSFCQESDDPNAAWNITLQACIHKLPEEPGVRGTRWPQDWPLRLEEAPYWLNRSQIGVFGKPAPEDFQADYEYWKRVVNKSYLNGMGIDWSIVRNVMDMRSVYGGFAAALREMNVWVMNAVPIDSADTLPIIYERGLFGIYHDWCESFSTYPRTYDLLHADRLFSKIKKRCKLLPVIAEVDRILRPEGKLIVRDDAETLNEVESMTKSLQWEIKMTYSKLNEGLLCVQKTMWRPKEVETDSKPVS